MAECSFQVDCKTLFWSTASKMTGLIVAAVLWGMVIVAATTKGAAILCCWFPQLLAEIWDALHCKMRHQHKPKKTALFNWEDCWSSKAMTPNSLCSKSKCPMHELYNSHLFGCLVCASHKKETFRRNVDSKMGEAIAPHLGCAFFFLNEKKHQLEGQHQTNSRHF